MGGMGGCSKSDLGLFSPNGPRGSREPSTGSKRVAGIATFLLALGPLLAGVLGEEVADVEGF